MRVVIDARFLSASGTGISGYIEGYINGITKSRIQLENEYIFLTPQGVDIHRRNIEFKVSNIPVVSMRQQLYIPFYLAKVKPDVYHYPHFDLQFIIKTPSVITVYDLKYIKMPYLLFVGEIRPHKNIVRLLMPVDI